MENILEDLWDLYLSEKDPQASDEEVFVTDMMEQDEEMLRADLNEKQEMLLGVLISNREHFAEIYGKKCFKKGVQFATKYLLEALKADKR